MNDLHLSEATEAQENAIRAVYDRTVDFHGDLTAPELAMKAGWRFKNYSELPPEQSSGDWWWSHPNLARNVRYREASDIVIAYDLAEVMSYDEFRASVQTGYDCLLVRWQGMTLGVELDGYVHS